MIIKFDHIAYACRRDGMDAAAGLFGGYRMLFRVHDVRNPAVKERLMSRHQEAHDLCLLEKEGGLPVEITAYDETAGGCPRYSVENNMITVFSEDEKESRAFYRAVGFRESGGRALCLKTAVDRQPVWIRIVQASGAGGGPLLDRQGFCCPAFVSNSAERDKKKLDGKGLRTTGIEGLRLHGKDLKIFFAYNEIGDVCEFIGVRQGRTGSRRFHENGFSGREAL